MRFSGNLVTTIGLPVARRGNLALKSGGLWFSFDKLWFYYYNRIPYKIIDAEDSANPASNDWIVIYSCYNVFKTQFETVIVYTKERLTPFPYGGLVGLNAELLGMGIILSPNNGPVRHGDVRDNYYE